MLSGIAEKVQKQRSAELFLEEVRTMSVFFLLTVSIT